MENLIDETGAFSNMTKKLHGMAQVYPKIYQEHNSNSMYGHEFYVVTLVHFNFRGITYERLCIESHSVRYSQYYPGIENEIFSRLKEKLTQIAIENMSMGVPTIYDKFIKVDMQWSQ